ncbi:pyruvate:ferredoxin (flavodoxin) oxidoreductase [Caproicibacter sp.]|uniref:pyruvate:ferredoxin (flavodoxin) oxidoreductase n=1 Tax=Caproicibacter sp. TaxID=2814884 RepID=UPI00398A3B02
MDSRKMKTMDGNNAAAYVSYAFTDVAAIYPITPSSVMADETDKYAAAGKKNLFGRQVQITEMQSEGGASGAVHGSLAAGALTTTYTASQGLLLMIPNMYKIAGEFLPAVMHVSARSLSTQALCIFGDHSDIYACRQTGFAMICSNSPQECMDLGAVAHLSAIKGSMPVMHFFDGFRTSHEIQKIRIWDDKDLAEMLDWDAVEKFRRSAMNPEHPVTKGTSENDDLFFQVNEASNSHYDEFPEVVVDYMNQVNAKLGTDYKPFNYYGAPDATEVIIAMGSVCECAEEVVDYLNAAGEKVGLVKVHLYRPFVAKYLLDVLPKTVKKISVLDRTKERGSIGEPLYLDIVAGLKGSEFETTPVYTGRYGLGSKDTNPGQIVAVYRNMQSASPKQRFTIGINDDVTNLSLEVKENPDTTAKGTHSCKFWGLGADGTVGANKNSIKIIGDHTDMYAQGYFAYDSKKSGGLTVSHLRFGSKPIKSSYYVTKADFVACHKPSYVESFDMVQDIKPGGSFLLNCEWETVEELDKHLPGKMKKYIADNNINFYTINGVKLGKELGLGARINTVLQSAFFAIANIIPKDQAIQYLKDAATKSYGKKGEKVVAMNHAAIERGSSDFTKVEVPASWKNAVDDSVMPQATGDDKDLVEYVNKVLIPANRYKGNEIAVSDVMKMADGTVPSGSSAYEKRGIAIDIPEWIPDNCIQCNQCSYVCPHAVIRPVVMTADEAAKAPEGMKMKDMTLMPGYKFGITISSLDCTGCGSCATICPGMKGAKALAMKPMDTQLDGQKYADYGKSLPEKPEVAAKFKPTSVKGSQFKKPLLEYSGACAGCGETPYAKLVTQLFGDRMYIANATGCSSIWGGSAPATPYTKNEKGFGPAWNNSLFEDNAEFGYGMALANKAIRGRLSDYVKAIEASGEASESLKSACKEYFDTFDSSLENRAPADKMIAELEKAASGSGELAELAKKTLADKDYLAKKSMWIFGGDGWAYDIGYGGLDHVLASGENVNILVFDTEVYSNTGGQASKSTPIGSVAQFAATGKSTKKKDLPGMAMTYGYVYVAHIAMGADYNQTIKAITEAENYDGPSLIVAYAPCINQGIKTGMGTSQLEEKKAVASGYWKNFRYDPRLAEEGKNPFQLDSKAPTESYRDFIMGEVRYNSLTRAFPERAEKLFQKAEKVAKEDYEHLEKLAKM